jgi:hypothetical protein
MLRIFLLVALFGCPGFAASPIDIGPRLEPLFDDHLIDKLRGDIRLQLHRPEPREMVFRTEKPWEGNTSAYYTIFEDDGLFRMYYRGANWDTGKKKATHPEVACYAESRDGIHWKKPNLGLIEFNGSKANNIVWDGIGTHNFTVFKDKTPNADPAAKYKAIARGRSLRKGDKKYSHGLYVYRSADGLRWEMIKDHPVITTGAFDSQNLAFFDPQRDLYVGYHRFFTNGVRAIMTCTSKDYINWTEPVPIQLTEKDREHLYTNAIQPYDRAPHIYVGFPTRYLPKQGQRVEPVFMTSRDRLNFNRWSDPVIPESAPKDRAGNRSNYMAWGVLALPGDKSELSVYASEAYYEGPDSRLRRFTYRVDGFVSLRAGARGGIMLSKPLVFSGNRLVLNHAVAKNGALSIDIVNQAGEVVAVSRQILGDKISGEVEWKSGDLKALSGKTVRLRVEAKNSHLYSLQFKH